MGTLRIYNVFCLLCGICCLLGSCGKESIDHIPKETLNTAGNSSHTNATNTKEYLPIRIQTFFTCSNEIKGENQKRLMEVVRKAATRVESLFSVQRGNGTLLLKRTPCPVAWKAGSGTNAGRCAKVRSNYRNEYCTHNVKIPNDHLEGLAVYNMTYDRPVHVLFQDGKGIPDADFVLYITAQTTANCSGRGSTVGAYVSHCRQDDNGRPTAGLLNFCPRHFQADNFNEKLTYVVCLHELFHALGFSSRLFEDFQDCSGGNCTRHDRKIFRPVLDMNRLVMPHVQAVAQRHFGCWEKGDFGGPIAHRGVTATSHWDERLMHGSIMAASLDLPHLVAVDPITLALFEDTGWYKVDYSKADPFFWGKDQGCNFGLPEFCFNQKQFFCMDESQGCHYLRKDKAVCSTSRDLKPCRIFQPLPEGSCISPKSANASELLQGEIFSPSSRCFMSTLTDRRQRSPVERTEAGPGCFEHQCVDGDLYIRPALSEWQLCTPGLSITFPDYSGEVWCPEKVDILCHEWTATTVAPTQSSWSRSSSPGTTDDFVQTTHSSEQRREDASYTTASCSPSVAMSTNISWWLAGFTAVSMGIFTHSTR